MADPAGHKTGGNDEVHDRIQSNTLSIAPVDRNALRQLYEEQREDSFVHPEPAIPAEYLPSYEEAVALGYKGLKELTEDASPTHAGEGNASGPRETVFLGRDKSKLKRKKSKKSKRRDGEESENKSEPTNEVEMVPLRIEVRADNSSHTWTEDMNGETEMGTTEGEDSPKKSRKKKKKKRFLEREASERDMTEMSAEAVQRQAGEIPDVELQAPPDQSQRGEDGALTLVSTNGEYSVLDEQVEQTGKKSKKKKKRRDTSPDEVTELGALEGEEESSWRKAKKKSKKKKKKIGEREVIEEMTGKELPDQENLPPQIPTAAYVEAEPSCTPETKETRALPPLLLKRMSSQNKIHAEDSGPVDSLPDQLREDTTLVGKSLPPISSMMGKGEGEKSEVEEGPGEKGVEERGAEEKEGKLRKPLLDKLKDLRSTHLRRMEEGSLTEDRSEPEEFECKRMGRLNSCCTAVGRFLTRCWRFLFRNRDWTSRESKCIIAIAISVVAAIVFLGLFPSSFVYLDYHEYALKYNKVTGVVDRSTTYDFGCYILGPSTAFLRFSRSAHVITKSHEVFTADKLSIQITYHLQYFLKKSEIGTLHRKFGTGYDSVIRSITESRVKNSAVSISVDYFRFQRAYLESYFHNHLKKRLEGDCCPSCCPTSCTNNTVCTTCLGPANCSQGYHIYVVYFQLTKVDIPQEVLERFLTSVILQEQVFTEQLKQDKAVEDKITERNTSLARNQANEIKESGKAEADKIRVISEADREANLTTAYVGALSSMYTTLGVTQEDHKLSIMMMRVLEEVAVKGSLYRSYGYDNHTLYSRPLALPAG